MPLPMAWRHDLNRRALDPFQGLPCVYIFQEGFFHDSRWRRREW